MAVNPDWLKGNHFLPYIFMDGQMGL